MTLRLRLVAAIVVLTVIGLGGFGVTTYAFYARSQHERLEEQLRASVPIVSAQLDARTREMTAGSASATGSPGVATTGSADGTGPTATGTADDGRDVRFSGAPTGGGAPTPPVVVAPSTYAERIDASGAVEASIQVSGSDGQPALPATLPEPGPSGTVFGAGSNDGSGDWLVFVGPADQSASSRVVVAVPVAEVDSSLHRLALIEAGAAVVLVAVLAGGSWLIVRRGLRPLEGMATSARSITAGDLGRRVAPADDRSEVGQLGRALNTMLEELERSFAERDATEHRLRQFLADASHELRTPLTSIQGFAELFRVGGRRDHVDQRVIMRRIEEESARMKGLVEDLLLLARLDEARPPESAPVDLAVLAADACSDAAAVAPDRAITLVAPTPVVVTGDRDHLRQAIANLVNNALTHTPDGTAIEVGALIEPDGTNQGSGTGPGDEDGTTGWAVVTVRDHGPGLTADAVDHAFDRFWQADGARTGSGAGLGLAIVAAIANEHGGRATGAAAGNGPGACFTIAIPSGGGVRSASGPVDVAA